MEISIITEPVICPCCGTALTKNITLTGESRDLYCPNEFCPDKIHAQICYFVSRGCMDIRDCADATIKTLINTKLVKTYKDIFNLDIDELIWVAGMTEYSAKKLCANINNARSIASGVTVLYSMGIPNIGRITAEKILDIVGDLNNLYNVIVNSDTNTINKIRNVIGDVATNSLITYNKVDDIKWFVDNGFNITTSVSGVNSVSNKLNGLRILASGTFENYSRDEIKNVIEENGGIYASGVNKKLNILVCGKNMGPSKLDKAKALGIKMISEEEFMTMIL